MAEFGGERCRGAKDLSGITFHSTKGLKPIRCNFCKGTSVASKWVCMCGVAVSTCKIHKDDPAKRSPNFISKPIHNKHDSNFMSPPLVSARGHVVSKSDNYFAVIGPRSGGIRLYSYANCPRLRAKFPKLFNS